MGCWTWRNKTQTGSEMSPPLKLISLVPEAAYSAVDPACVLSSTLGRCIVARVTVDKTNCTLQKKNAHIYYCKHRQKPVIHRASHFTSFSSSSMGLILGWAKSKSQIWAWVVIELVSLTTPPTPCTRKNELSNTALSANKSWLSSSDVLRASSLTPVPAGPALLWVQVRGRACSLEFCSW